MSHVNKVYLVIHELFGVSIEKDRVFLVTPKVTCSELDAHAHGHEYVSAQFKDGAFRFDAYGMAEGATYQLRGILPGRAPVFPDSFNPCPGKEFSRCGTPFCTWELPFPRKIHQLRLVDIETSKPLFAGADGEYVDDRLRAVSIVQVFEYLPNGDEVQIVTTPKEGEPKKQTYQVDPMTHTVNLHIWAEIGHPHFGSTGEAIQHSIRAFNALRSLFHGLDMIALNAVPTDPLHGMQPPLPEGFRFVEMLTLPELRDSRKYSVTDSQSETQEHEEGVIRPRWTPRTCGVAGNLYVRSSS
jgi:hypothetical protein